MLLAFSVYFTFSSDKENPSPWKTAGKLVTSSKTNMAACTDEKSTIENVLKNMCLKIANSDVIVKSQQRDEPDLTVDQKVDILKDILDKKPAVFLTRFGKFLTIEELLYFESIESNDYELQFRLKELQKLSNDKTRHVKIQNRRYEALKRLTKDSDYFNESEMRKRNPLLYEQYIGQYLTDEERQERDTAEQPRDPSLSDILIHRFDSQQTEWMYQYQQEKEGGCEEEEDDESDDSMSEDEDLTKGNSNPGLLLILD